LTCKGICENEEYRGTKSGRSWYASGFKWCTHCEKFMKCDQVLCPCCNKKLKTKPSSRKWKEKLGNETVD